MKRSDWIDFHKTIFSQTRERIELAFEKASQQGLENPVVLVLDLHDDEALGIARTSGRDQGIEDVVAQAESRGFVPICIWHLPGVVATKLLRDFSDVAAGLREPAPQGTFHTVIVAAEGASLALTPCP